MTQAIPQLYFFEREDQQPVPPPDDITARQGSQIASEYNLRSRDLPQALRQNFAENFKPEEFDPVMLQLLAGLEFTTNSDGTLEIYKNGEVTHRVSPEGSVDIGTDSGPLDSPENINAFLEGAVIAKAVSGERGMYMNTDDPEKALIMAKTAELAGLEVHNPPENTLDSVNPELAQKIEQAWANMQAANGGTPSQTAEFTSVREPDRTASATLPQP